MRHQRLLILLLLLFGSALTVRAQAGPVRVGILVYDGVYNTEMVAPLDVFQHAANHTGGRLAVFTVAPRMGSVTTAEGLRFQPDYSFLTAPTIDWLVVPSGKNYETDVDDTTLVDWIRETGRRARVLHSNCWGAFLLGTAGLLEGKSATTYPPSLDRFAARFPRVTPRRDVLFVDDNDIVTSTGGVPSYYAALYLLEKHFGREVAEKVAAGLVVDWDLARVRHETVAASGSP